MLKGKFFKRILTSQNRRSMNGKINMKKIFCPKCKQEIWDVATPDQRLNKCWQCEIKFENKE